MVESIKSIHQNFVGMIICTGTGTETHNQNFKKFFDISRCTLCTLYMCLQYPLGHQPIPDRIFNNFIFYFVIVICSLITQFIRLNQANISKVLETTFRDKKGDFSKGPLSNKEKTWTFRKVIFFLIKTFLLIRAGEPEPKPVGAGCFWLLGAGAA